MVFQVSLEKLNEFAAAFWNRFNEGKVFAFHGEMGAGKTTIISALCRHKGVKDMISSPTFSIINEYSFDEKEHLRKIYHMDWYRLNSVEEIMQAGVEECMYSGEICFIEWPGKAPELLDEDTVHVFIETIDAGKRQVNIETAKPGLVW